VEARAPDWPDGVGRVILAEVDSTNAEAERRASAGERGPLWIMARRQTAGRGRVGRGWAAPEGNLSATFLFAPGLAPAEAALMSFTAARAVAELAMGAGVPAEAIRLKWPNDVLIAWRKVAGILLASSGAGQRVDWLAVGIGVNLAASPGGDTIRPGGRPPTALAEHGARLDPEEALTRLATAFETLRARHATEGFAAIRPLWLALAAGLGQRVEADTGSERLAGVFADMDAEGRLVLETAHGRPRALAAADIRFPD
jgi:BirA family biotin operon repressor/biotin-[acetyl-CoA-carboxylase] ligase